MHIDSQILILRDFIDALQSYVADASTSDTYISATHMRTLHDVRRDVVNTIRQVVDVVSTYAGGALPEPARARVRGFILHLPKRWASATNGSATHGIPEGTPGASSAAGASAGGPGNNRRSGRHRKERNAGGPDRSLSGTPASSRASSPLASSRTTMGRPTASAATRAAQHILTLATESLDMMRGVTGVVKESLDRADLYVVLLFAELKYSLDTVDGWNDCGSLGFKGSSQHLTNCLIPRGTRCLACRPPRRHRHKAIRRSRSRPPLQRTRLLTGFVREYAWVKCRRVPR